PLLRRVMRCMGRAGRVLDEDRLARISLVDPRHPVDGIVSHRRDEVPAWLALEWINLRGVAEQVRLPLVGVAADEAVEIFEAHAGRPPVERSDLAGGKCRGVVVFAEPRGRVAIIEEHAANGGLVLVDYAVVAGEAG